MARARNFSIPVSGPVDDDTMQWFKKLSRPLIKHFKNTSYYPPRCSRPRPRKLSYPPFEKSQLTSILLHDLWLQKQVSGNWLDARIFLKEVTDDESVVGAIVVAEVGRDRFIIVQDKKKRLKISHPDGSEESRERWGFPGGHREKDEKLLDTVYREFLEECGINIHEYRVTPKRIGTIALRSSTAVGGSVQIGGKSAVFYVALPKEVEQKLVPGEEQEALMVVDLSVIHFLIEGEPYLFLFNHINVLTLFTQWKKERNHKLIRN